MSPCSMNEYQKVCDTIFFINDIYTSAGREVASDGEKRNRIFNRAKVTGLY